MGGADRGRKSTAVSVDVISFHFPPLHFGASFSSPTFSFLAFSASPYIYCTGVATLLLARVFLAVVSKIVQFGRVRQPRRLLLRFNVR